jgi:uncharacterized membrane protein YsdA (DUF1294 family)
MSPQTGLILMGIWNLAVFLLYGCDKALAKGHLCRISEKTLLTASLVAGGVGAWCGMHVFHHKTQKGRFVWTGRISLVLTLGIGAALVYSIYCS